MCSSWFREEIVLIRRCLQMLLSIHNIVGSWNLNLNIRPIMNVVILIHHHLSISTSVKILSRLIHILITSWISSRKFHMLCGTTPCRSCPPLSSAVTISFNALNQFPGFWVYFTKWINSVCSSSLLSHLIGKCLLLITSNQNVLLTILCCIRILKASLTIVDILRSHISSCC